MKTSSVRWPEKEDYEMAMEALYEKVHDPIIKHGKIHKDQTGPLRYGGANLYVTLYRVDDWMVRCFCRNDAQEPPLDILARYQHISKFCQTHAATTPTLVPVIFIDNAIEVDFFDRSGNNYTLLKTEALPFVRMKFVTALALGSFIKVNYHKQAVMQELCDAWLRMTHDLKRIQMAHGDLDLTNVLVTQEPSGLVLKLIDYDNAWVPALHAQYKQTEVGHEHFQHPAFQRRDTRPYDEHMDNFSILTMYISLKMLALHPDLYTKKEWGPDDIHHLLLTSADYQAEMNKKPNNITRLHAFHIKELEPLLKELSLALQEKRQASNLTELLRKDEVVLVYDDWDKAELPAKKEIVEKLLATPQTQPNTPWTQTQPATGNVQAQAQVPSVDTTLDAPPKQKRSNIGILVLVILFIIIVVVVLLMIVSTSQISSNPASILIIGDILRIHFAGNMQFILTLVSDRF